MILFLEDWKKYPNAIIDDKTTNDSFVRIASVYRSMGIENHAFPLALLNPQLQGVDPFSPYLTPEQMYMIALECKHNPWYFFREIAKAPPSGGNEAMRLQANRSNIALYWLFFNHITQFLIQPRQTGKSFSTDSLMVLLLNVICIATKINLLTKDDNLRRANVRRLKDLMEQLPPYLLMRRPDDTNNTEEITINALENRYNTHVPQSSPKRADNMGRGLTTAVFHVDEAPFQVNIEIALKAALPAMTAAIESAKAEGAPYGTIFTTTAGKKDDKDGAFIYKELMDSAPWTEKFFDCKDAIELEQTIRTNSRGGKVRVRCVFNHRQLGKSDEWMLRALEESFQSGDSANRDFFNMWTSGSQTNPIPIRLLERISGSYMGELHAEVSNVDRYITRWYIPADEIHYRMATGKFALMIDSSEAIGNDDIGMLVMDLETCEVVASGTFNETNLIRFSAWLFKWFVRFENITGIIERRSTGGMILDYLIHYMVEAGMDPFRRLFNTVVQEFRENRSRYEEIQKPMNRRDPDIYVKFKSSFGFATSGSGTYSRNELYSSTLMMAAQRGCDAVHDKGLIDQINALINKNGRVDHPDGGHDDMVIAWLLGFWFMTKGVNLAFYGINSNIIMARAMGEKEGVQAIEGYDHEEQTALRERIEKMTEELAREKDKFVAERMEQLIRSLMKNVIMREGEVFSVDELLRTAKEKRMEKRRMTLNQPHPYAMHELSLGTTGYNTGGFNNGYYNYGYGR